MSQAGGFKSCGFLHNVQSKIFHVGRRLRWTASWLLSSRSFHSELIQQATWQIHRLRYSTPELQLRIPHSLSSVVFFSIHPRKNTYSNSTWLFTPCIATVCFGFFFLSQSLLGNGSILLLSMFKLSPPHILIPTHNPLLSFFPAQQLSHNLYCFLDSPGKFNTEQASSALNS